MDRELYRRAKAIFLDACDLGAAEQSRYLDDACGDDAELRAAVEKQLAHDAAPNPALESGGLRSQLEKLIDSDSAAATAATSTLDGSLGDPERVGPYKILDKLGEGGMGTVYLCEQLEPVRRKVAVKIIKAGMDTREVLARFEVEQHALTIMNHAHIARVLDAGATPEGRPFFVMDYVPGVSLTEYCDRERLTTRERLELFLPICEAVQHAHQKGVIHRDLKPSNILVMVQDEKPVPKIIDFGVAKATGPRLTERTLHTGVGRIIGTLEYMSPEQAELSGVDIDTRTDVYSLGVILYELLVGVIPFDSETMRDAGYAEIQRIIREQDPPTPSSRLRNPDTDLDEAASKRGVEPRQLVRHLKGDLDWITLKCLEKNRRRRYESAAQLAEDISRHLRDEPVLAGPPSLTYQLGKFARRHRPTVIAAVFVAVALVAGVAAGAGGMAAAAAVVLVLLLVGLATTTALLRMARQARLGEARQREIAEERLAEVLRLSDVKRLSELEAHADELWPAVPDKLDALTAWLAEAEGLIAHSVAHRETLERLRAVALERNSEDVRRDQEEGPVAESYRDRTAEHGRVGAEIAELERDIESHEEPTIPVEEEAGRHQWTRAERETRLAALRRQRRELQDRVSTLEQRLVLRRTWRFTASEDQWRHDVLGDLVEGLEVFAKSGGLVDDVRARLELAESIEARTLSSPEARSAWSEATRSIRELDLYAGLELPPQLGLLPLGRDPSSGLWEFWHVASGARPESESEDGVPSRWRIEEATGVVLVLLPGGRFHRGAQRDDERGVNFDPLADDDEGPPREVTVKPFFIGRYQMTQGQWLRITGRNPSYAGPNFNGVGRQHDLRHPVESVSRTDCVTSLGNVALRLPTETQWEYAARAGTSTPWWTGAEVISLQGAANLADRFAKLNGPSSWITNEELFDGYVGHAPVGMFRANGFGIHDVHGNVWEWCDEESTDGRDGDRRFGTGRIRGGGCSGPAVEARSANRFFFNPGSRQINIGCRAARSIDGAGP